MILALACALLGFAAPSQAKQRPKAIEWEASIESEGHLFPSLIIATATMKPDEDEEQDEHLLGDVYGLVGAEITAVKAHTPVKVTIRGTKLFEKSVWEGELPKAGETYSVAPQIHWNYDALRRNRQQVPVSITIEVESEGKSLGTKTLTATVRSINDCLFGMATSEEFGNQDSDSDDSDEDDDTAANKKKASTKKGDDDNDSSEEADNTEWTDYGWMFAAYVNENHPLIDKILKEALDAGTVEAFDGYQSGNPKQVINQVYAIWNALQRRGIKYSDITATPGGAKGIYSQHVRFLDESANNAQANCVDGSVLMASLLRKISLKPFLVLVPGHMFLGVYLDQEGNEFIGVETTMLGQNDLRDKGAGDDIKKQLPEKAKNAASGKTFAAAVQTATKELKKNTKKFESDDPQWQLIDIEEAREMGVMPIAYLKDE